MRKSVKILLTDMKARLQAIEHYDNPDVAFDTLLYSWNKYRKASSESLVSIKKRGSMSSYLARSFAQYCGYPIDRNTKT